MVRACKRDSFVALDLEGFVSGEFWEEGFMAGSHKRERGEEGNLVDVSRAYLVYAWRNETDLMCVWGNGE